MRELLQTAQSIDRSKLTPQEQVYLDLFIRRMAGKCCHAQPSLSL
jgi:hypothetical protein